jgi:hypothetical protein
VKELKQSWRWRRRRLHRQPRHRDRGPRLTGGIRTPDAGRVSASCEV